MTRSTDQISQGLSELSNHHEGHILLAHGGGGVLTEELVRETMLPRIGNDILNQLMDSGVMPLDDRYRLALTIDSYVVQGYVVEPWRFPGGDIGKLAVCGTVNDLAVTGAQPMGIALGLIIAEGLSYHALETVLASAGQSASDAGVKIVTGDTKVVGHDQADKIYITTAGVGRIPVDMNLNIDLVRPGDKILINGPIAQHGLAVMLARSMPEVQTGVRSDVAPLNELIRALLEQFASDVVFMRDATRGGLAGVAADIALHSGKHVALDEVAIPIHPETLHVGELLGLDPLEVANEGKVVTVVRPDIANEALALMRSHPLGEEAAIIGEVESIEDGICELRTKLGGRRVVQKPYGEQLPRIC